MTVVSEHRPPTDAEADRDRRVLRRLFDRWTAEREPAPDLPTWLMGATSALLELRAEPSPGPGLARSDDWLTEDDCGPGHGRAVPTTGGYDVVEQVARALKAGDLVEWSPGQAHAPAVFRVAAVHVVPTAAIESGTADGPRHYSVVVVQFEGTEKEMARSGVELVRRVVPR